MVGEPGEGEPWSGLGERCDATCSRRLRQQSEGIVVNHVLFTAVVSARCGSRMDGGKSACFASEARQHRIASIASMATPILYGRLASPARGQSPQASESMHDRRASEASEPNESI